MPFADRTGIADVVSVALGTGNDPRQLPEKMLCPSGHITYRYFIARQDHQGTIPTYICESCCVTYRYHELLTAEKERQGA